jgi:energy-coupling factor transporter ATP-binding protein EcfA2
MENIVNAWVWIPIAIGVGTLVRIGLTKFGQKLKEKKLGIIGLRGSGKTTLAEFLANNELPEKTQISLFENNYKHRTLGDLGMNVCITDSKSNHTQYAFGEEKEILRNCDIILYLFDMSKFFDSKTQESYFKRISQEIRLYAKHLKDLQTARKEKRIIKSDTANAVLGGLLEGFTFGLSKIVGDKLTTESSEPREKKFIALGTFFDIIYESGITKEEFDLQSAGIREKFKKLFEHFNDIISWEIIFFNSLKDDDAASETVEKIFESLKDFYGLN